MNTRIIILVFCTFVFLSCATEPMELINVQTIYPRVTKYSIPEKNKENTVNIGESLIKEGSYSSKYVLVLKNDYGTQGWTSFHPAGIYEKVAISDDYVIYQYQTQIMNGLTYINPQILENRRGEIFLKRNTSLKKIEATDYEKNEISNENDNKFEQLLLFTGTNGTVLLFSYREFSEDFARPAFTIELSYDMSINKIVRIKGAQLEILKYDNQSITYKMLSGFRD
jgi:hypothetical protein